MNYTDKQIKLAGVIQPESGAREFEQGLDLQGEGIRVLQNDRTIFEENVGDCCEDLQTCELALNACDAEKTALETENADLIEENQELQDFFDSVVGGSTFTENVYGFFDDPGYGSLTTFLSLTSTFNPSTSTVTMYAYGYVTVVDNPRIAGLISTISASRYYKADGSSYKNIANSGFSLYTSDTTISETTTSSYDPSFAPGGYVLGSKSAYKDGGRLPEPFTWSPLPPIP